MAVVSLILGLSVITFKQFYTATRSRASVDASDKAAFHWIDQNIPDSEKFINAGFANAGRPDVVFASDGGLWLSTYTGNDVSLPFHEGRFSTTKHK